MEKYEAVSLKVPNKEKVSKKKIGSAASVLEHSIAQLYQELLKANPSNSIGAAMFYRKKSKNH